MTSLLEPHSTAPSVEPGGGQRRMEEHPAWPMISQLRVSLSAAVPLSGLTVRQLLELHSGHTVRTSWAATEDVPLKVGSLHVASGEFEVVEQRMALRLTRLA